VTTYIVNFRKRLFQPPRTIRLELFIPANSWMEARQIATKETAALRGYRYDGVN
jgi:hypothetical protein